MSSEREFVAATQKWLRTVVIGHSFCPFAKREFARDNIAYRVCHSAELETGLAALLELCQLLDDDESKTTALLIFAGAYEDFDDYLSLITAGEDLILSYGYEGVYQIASFHPRYCFAGAGADDAANYTNRSPYPMLHLLRESRVETALAGHPNPETIPEDNIRRAEALGVEAMAATLRECFIN
jgi:hypothetical protein